MPEFAYFAKHTSKIYCHSELKIHDVVFKIFKAGAAIWITMQW